MRPWIRILIAFTLLCTAGVAFAARFDVAPNTQYNTIASVYPLTSPGDTIVIAPGIYSENVTVAKRLTLIGSGMGSTVVQGYLDFSTNSSGSKMEGVTVLQYTRQGGATILGSNVGPLTFSRCRFQNGTSADLGSTANWYCVGRTGTGRLVEFRECVFRNYTYDTWDVTFSSACVLLQNDSALFSNCVFAHSNARNTQNHWEELALKGTARSVWVGNCVFAGLGRIISVSGSYPFYFVNNVMYDWTNGVDFGEYPNAATIDYNASSGSLPPGSHPLLLSTSPFVNYNTTNNYDYDTSDLHLVGGSSCIDAGSPDILDLNGTRSDLGIFGGPWEYVVGGVPSFPIVNSLTVPPMVTAGSPLQIQSQGRIGRGN